MANIILRQLGTWLNRAWRNDLNANFTDIETELNAQDSRINNIVVSAGDSSAEVVDARGGEPTLRTRLDLADTATQTADAKATANASAIGSDTLKTVAQTIKAAINENYDKLAAVDKSKVYIEKYPRLGAETDDTARIQRAIDAAVEYAELIFDPSVSYTWSNLVATKSLDLNGNGATATVDPTTSGVTGAPAIWFKGTLGTSYNIPATINERATQIALTTGDGSNFANGDYVVIGDSKQTPSWDGTGFTYTGRWEVNLVTAVSTDTLTLARPLEWTYDTTPTIQKITKVLKQPTVRGFAKITEVDPGSASSTANAGDPHILQFQYCFEPKVERCIFDRWQLHAINFHRCIQPIARNNQAYDPFRPQSGGHGYMIKLDNSSGGVFEGNFGKHVRHLVDWSRSYDGVSSKNYSLYPYGVSFYTHGLGSKRAKSVDDTVVGVDSNSEGWAMGNQDFNADYDYTIINPTYRGEGIAIGMKTYSKGMRVINPHIRTNNKYAVGVARGAEDFRIEGGTIENYGSGTFLYAILCRAEMADGATAVALPKDIYVKNVKIRGNAIVHIDAQGIIDVDGLDSSVTVTPNGGLAGALRVAEVTAPTDLSVRNCRIRGSFDRGIYGSQAPTRFYRVEANEIEGYATNGIQLRSSSALRMFQNVVKSNGSTAELSFSGTLSTDITNGAILEGNTPSTYDNAGTKTVIALGLTAMTAASAANGQLFIDSADNKLKFKDSTGTVQLLY